MEVNRAEVVAQVSAAFETYERALVDNDIGIMNALFWDTPETVRYGIAEVQLGSDAIRAFAERFAAWREAGTQFRHLITNLAVQAELAKRRGLQPTSWC